MLKMNMLVGSLVLAGASLAHAEANTVNGSMTVQATLVSACEVSASGSIDFGSVVALASTGDQSAQNTSGFQVACSSDLSPRIYSTTTRAMLNGEASLPFELCLGSSCDGENALASTQESADTLSITQNGSLQNVALSARIRAVDFKALPSGAYAKVVVVNVDY